MSPLPQPCFWTSSSTPTWPDRKRYERHLRSSVCVDHAVIEVHRASSGPPRLPLRLIRRAVPIVVDGLDRTLEGITIATHEQVKEYNRDVATLETIP